ncbi:MAG: AAA domain-containing protein, partial [Candidatus Heimdallarchaeaceae archaeon]
LEPYTKLTIYNIKKIPTDNSPYFSAGSDSIVVVDPDILINATDISSVSFCPRSYYLSQIIGDQASPYIAVRGTIVHNCLSQAISSGNSPSEVLPKVLDSFSLHYETLNYDRDKVQQEVQPMTEALDSFVNNLPSNATPELLFLSPAFGIRGRIDLLVGHHIYELKTAKRVSEDKIRFSDLVQVSVYSYGSANTIDNPVDVSGSVLYVGSNELVTKEVLPTKEILRYAMQMRNLAYRISYLGYVPPILPLSQGKRCDSCSMRFVCLMVCAKLNQQRTCSSCPHNDFCTKEELPKSHQDYFNHFTKLLRLEKNEWSRNLADLWNLDVNQRVARGRAIKDLKLVSTYSEDGRSYHLFSCKNNSEIREGDIVLLSNGDILNDQLTSGKVSRIAEDFIEIETHGLQSSVSVVDIYSIDVNFRRQQRGIYNIIFKNNNYKQYLIDNVKPKIVTIDGTFIKNNKAQNEAIAKILGTEGYCLIQGPAGTGKTHVIARSAIILANNKRRVLITAFTNRAVDNVCKYLLANQFFSFIRLGETHAIDRELRDYTIESYKKRLNEDSTLTIIKQIPIIVATTSTISNPLFETLDIDIIIVDEASQMTEPNVLSALIGGSALILVGDHKQLPPVVQNPQAYKKGLSISLFERLAKQFPSDIHLLDLQFRMNEKLMEFSNTQFYEGKLKSYDNLVKNQNLLDLANFTSDYYNFPLKEIYDPKNPLIFVRTDGTFNPEKKVNIKEAKIIGEVTTNFLKCGISSDQIGIIAPFRGQVGEIRRHVPLAITVDTVDRFQGTDKEIIILSITETHPSSNRGLGDERRLNVAITRAKKKLIVVGSDEISKGIIGAYVSYLKENAMTVSIKEEKKKEIIRYFQKTIIVADSISKTARFIKKVQIAGKKLANSRKNKNICMICFQPVYENAVECPMCNTIYHFDHLVNWVKENERCPYCKTSLTILSI